MANVRVKTTDYKNGIRSVSGIPDSYVNLPAQMAVSHAKTVNGRLIIAAGTCVTGAINPNTRKSGLTPIADAKTAFDGVIFADAEVAPGETVVNVAVMVKGFPLHAALQKVGTPAATPETIANPNLILVK